jgi:hypothetical protein
MIATLQTDDPASDNGAKQMRGDDEIFCIHGVSDSLNRNSVRFLWLRGLIRNTAQRGGLLANGRSIFLRMGGCGSPRQVAVRLAAGSSRIEQRQLVVDTCPVRMIGQRCLGSRDATLVRTGGEVRIQCNEVLLIKRHFMIADNRAHGTFGYAHRAIDTFVGINRQEIRTLEKTVHRADIDAVRIFAVNAGLCDDKRHGDRGVVLWDRL